MTAAVATTGLANKVPWSYSNTDHQNYDTAVTSHTFAGVNIGQQTARRLVVVAVMAAATADNSNITGCTVNGVAATAIGSAMVGAYNTVRFYVIDMSNAGGSSADIAVSCDTTAYFSIGVWALQGYQSATPTSSSNNRVNSSSVSTSITGPTDGVVLAAANDKANSGTYTWTNATKDFDSASSQRAAGGAHAPGTGASVSISVTGPANFNALAAVALH